MRRPVPPLPAALSVPALITALAAGLAGCAGEDGTGPRLTVFAAASLTRSFTEIGDRFRADNPDTVVDVNVAGSTALVAQLTQGAAADVFASADTANMDKAVQAGLVDGEPVDFASNTLVVVTAPGNPEGIGSFADLARPGLSVVVCAPPVPCGAATATVEEKAGVRLHPVSEESSVADVLNKVTSGQADAGVVYVTDARGAGDKVDTVTFPESSQAVNTYPIAVLDSAADPDLARRFVAFVSGEVGQDVLHRAGFAGP